MNVVRDGGLRSVQPACQDQLVSLSNGHAAPGKREVTRPYAFLQQRTFSDDCTRAAAIW